MDGFLIDLSLLQKAPALPPQGFEPLYTADDWQAYRLQFGAEADALARLKSSAIIAFAEKLRAIAAPPSTAAASVAPSSTLTPGFRRLLLLRSAAIAYRSRDGFPTADKAVTAYLALMDKHAATQMGGLWTLANALSRTAATPKPDRIRYDAIAAKANLQLAQLLLDGDQVAAAETLMKQIAYHEGWLKSDPTTCAQIAHVRALVKQTSAMMAYLSTQYQPAIRNDEQALLVVYLYGRFVKNNITLVSDLPGRVPNSQLAQLATALDAASRDPQAGFVAAERLREVAMTVPDLLIKQRTLYAALMQYQAFLKAPQTERDRIHRTLARMSVEAVIADGAHKGGAIDPFAAPVSADPSATRSAPPVTAPAAPMVAVFNAGLLTIHFPQEQISSELEQQILEGADQPWRASPETLAPFGLTRACQAKGLPADLKSQFASLAETAPRLTSPTPADREAIWQSGQTTVSLTMTSTRPTDPDTGVWTLTKLTVSH